VTTERRDDRVGLRDIDDVAQRARRT
jgi:hypothetical protein